ncbi:MAG: VTT domain-containing protein [Acidobacteria bacterium]|nr:VTT domain-containing protein [Acidobacteriota bacterium]MCI0663845.1 VTT domain-containing protein [Acidobacteriota bacterium]
MLDWFIEWFLGISRQVVGSAVYIAAPMMILVGALDSSLLSLPEVNDYITVARIANNPSEVYYFPLFPAIGSVIGCLVLYRIARRGEQFITKRFHPKQLDRVKALYRRWGLFALVIPAILPPPMPFKIFVVTAGALGYPMGRFAAVIMLARTARYYFWGILAFFFRNEVRKMIDWLGENLLVILGVLIAAFILFLIARWMMARIKGQPAKGKAEVSYTD